MNNLTRLKKLEKKDLVSIKAGGTNAIQNDNNIFGSFQSNISTPPDEAAGIFPRNHFT